MPCRRPRVIRRSRSTFGTPPQLAQVLRAFVVRVALVHDWLLTWRGGERVLEAMAELYPEAELFTLFYSADKMPESIRSRAVHASFLDGVPGVKERFRSFLPLFPAAIEAMSLE